MKILMWVGIALVAIGILLIIIKFALKKNMQSGINWSMRIGFGFAAFYIICQFIGLYLQMTPAINFADSKNFEFNLVEFWIIGAAFLVTAIVMKLLGRSKQDGMA